MTKMDDVITSFRAGKERRCTCSLYMTEQCNLNCIYCYEHIKRERLLPIEVAKKGIESTFDRAVRDNIDYVEILFHGGEPFMAFPRIKEICEWIWSREWPRKYICYATTNGTLVHGDIKRWLTASSFCGKLVEPVLEIEFQTSCQNPFITNCWR